MTALPKVSTAMTVAVTGHHNVAATAYFKQAAAVDNADTRAAYQQGYTDCAEADRRGMDGAGNRL